MAYLHGAWEIWTDGCLVKLHECLEHDDPGGFGFVEGTFYGIDISFCEAIVLGL